LFSLYNHLDKFRLCGSPFLIIPLEKFESYDIGSEPEFDEDILKRSNLTRFAWLSIAAAISTIALKSGAYLLTGSVGFLSDAVESIVNLFGAMMALWMLTIAARPADESHMYGHSKAEYFSSAVEGGLILIAAGMIIFTAVQRLLNPQELEQIGVGIVVSIAASVINFLVSVNLKKAGKTYNSITLEADAAHLMTDVWTSAGVILAVVIISISKWTIIDPLIALVVAVNIVWTGIQLIRRSISGLMDASLPQNELNEVEVVLEKYRQDGIQFHALRTRQAASRRFISVHILVPGDTTVHDGHHIASDLENDLLALFDEAVIFTHLEPIEDVISSDDIQLDRVDVEKNPDS
jgi:cation diffusion facilitator family transporter